MLRNLSTNTQSLPDKQPVAGYRSAHRSAPAIPMRRQLTNNRTIVFALLFSCLVGGLLFSRQQPAFAESNALPVAQAGQGKLAVVGAQGTDLYDAPGGTAGESLTPGTTLTAIGRTADSLWIAVVTDDEANGWVETSTIVIFGAEQLPVNSDLPAAAPTSAATAVEEEPADGTATAVEEMAPTSTSVAPTMTATSLPSPTPTAVPPTATPTEVPPTATPLPTATALLPFSSSSELIAVVGSNGVNLSPEQNGSSGIALPVGTALTAIGRSADSTMLYVTTTDGNEGWVLRSDVVAFNTGGLPVLGEDGMTPADADPVDEAPVDEATMNEAEATTTTEEAMVEEPTATATFVPTAVPTMTNTPLPTPTPTQAMRPTPKADGRPTAQVAMTGSRLNIRSGPSTQFPVIGKALPREIFIANGRNGDNTWVQLAVPDLSGGFGWVTSNLVTLSEPIAELPIALETNDAAAPQSSTIAVQLASNPAPAMSSAATPAIGSATNASAQSAPAAQPAGLSGKMTIQTQWGGTFYLYDLASGTLAPVTGGLDPALSPDGSQIAFTRIGGNAGGLYLINSDGSNERQIFKASEQIMAPKWSPDGKWVVFSRSNGSYTCNDIAFVGCLSDGQLFPSPPGGLPPALEEARQDVLDGFDRVSRPNWQLSRVNLDGKEYRDLAALDSARAPDWTDAGIVYQSGGGLQITQDKPDGETRQVYYDGWDWDPDWQPGGGRIVFQSKEGPHWEIFAVNPDGNGLTAFTRPVTTLVDELPSNVSPAWSPDGQYIAYLSNRMDNNEAGPWRVWVMGADGSNQRPLPINLPINYGFAGEQMISWSQ